MRRAVLPIAVLLLAALAAAVAFAGVGGGEPGARAATISTSGDIEISNDRDGLPILVAAGIGPGDSARGTVEITATGSAPVELTLSRHDLLDTPGLGGGLLSPALTLTVTDVTNPVAPLAVYAGPLDSMPAQPAGRLAPGAARTYEFVAMLPAAGGTGDQNAMQGASVSVAYAWTATEAGEEGEPGPGPEPEPGTPGGGPASEQPPANAPTPTAVPLPGVAFDLAVTRAARALRRGGLVVWAGCNRTCALVARGRLRATAGSHHRGAKVRFGNPSRYRAAGVRKLRIRVPAQLRRWLATAPGKRRLRAKLVFTATDPPGARDTVRRTLVLRAPRRR